MHVVHILLLSEVIVSCTDVNLIYKAKYGIRFLPSF